MMKSIVEEKLVSFKTLEQKVFAYVCELGREMQTVLQAVMKQTRGAKRRLNSLPI